MSKVRFGSVISTVWLLVTVMTLLLHGCRNDRYSHPEDLNQMKEVFTEIYYARAAFETLPASVRDSMLNHYKSQILKNHGITDSAFEHRIHFYNAHPEALESLEREVRDELLKNIASDSTQLVAPATSKETMN